MGHSTLKKITKNFNSKISKPSQSNIIKPSQQGFRMNNTRHSSSKPINNQVIQPTQQIFTGDAVKNVINPIKNINIDDGFSQNKNKIISVDTNMEKLFGDKKSWNNVGKDINKGTRNLGSGIKEVYNDTKGLAKTGLDDFFGYLRSPQFLLIGGVVLVGGVILLSNSKK